MNNNKWMENAMKHGIAFTDETTKSNLYSVVVGSGASVFVNANSFNEAAAKALKHETERMTQTCSDGTQVTPNLIVSSVEFIKKYIS